MIDIQHLIDIDYLNDNRKSRKKKTQEIFTPYSIVKKLMDKVPETDWADPSKTFLDPAAGNGNIILGILYRRIYEYNVDWQTALETCYGVELMSDNVRETKERILSLLTNMGIEYDEKIAREIMDRNLVCSNFFDWDFENWRPKQLYIN